MTTLEATIEIERSGAGWAVRLRGIAGTLRPARIASLADSDLSAIAGLPESARTWEGFAAALCPNTEFKPALAQLEAVGAVLRERLFGAAPAWLSEMEAAASTRRASLRFALVLDEDEPALEAIPWELCRQGSSFLFKRGTRVAARCVGEVPYARAARLKKGDTLLIVTAHEDNRAPSEADLLAHATAVRASAERIGLLIEHLPGVTRDALQARLLDADRPLHALYVVCHGQHDPPNRGRLSLRGPSLSGTDLASWVAERAEQTGPLEAVILCACSSSVPAPGTSGMAQWLVKKDARWNGLRSSAVRAALGFRGPVKVTWALGFMEKLFEAVSDGASVDVAVAAARAAQAEADPQWALPLLYTPHLDASAVSVRSALPGAVSVRSASPSRTPELGGFESFTGLASLLPRAPVPYFVAREVERSQLATWLKAPGCAAITSVAGEGGVGKTELAHAVAHDAAKAGRTVLWLDAAGRELRALASTLLRHVQPDAEIGPNDDDAAVAARMREALRPHRGLLVLDDVADARTVQALSPGSSWNVLITTRTLGLLPGIDDVALVRLTAAEGIALLARIAWSDEKPPPDEAVAADLLVEALGGLPLAIDLAGHTIRSGALSATTYLSSYYLPEGAAATDRARAEAALLRAQQDLDETALHALQVLSLLPGAGATREMVATALELSEPAADRALVRLRRLGIAGFIATTGRYTLHPIVRAAIRREMERDAVVWERGLAGVERAMKQVAVPLDVGGGIERAHRHWSQARDLFDSLDLAPWLSSARGSTELAGVYRLADQLRLDETLIARLLRIESTMDLAAFAPARIRASLHDYRGRLRYLHDDFEGARTDCEAALHLYKEAGSALGQANTLSLRGDLRSARGERDGAAADFDAALRLYQGEGSRLGQANVLRSRGELRMLNADLEGAEADLETALDFYQELGNRLGRAAVRRWQGDLAMKKDDPARALSLYQEAEGVYRALGDAFGQSSALAHIARANALLGRADDTRRAANEALEIGVRAQNPYALKVAQLALNELASTPSDGDPSD